MNTAHQNACIIFNKLVVNAVENTSGIFVGTNYAVGWSTYSKSNQGFGSAHEAGVTNMVNVINDQDRIDMITRENKRIGTASECGLQQQCDIAFQSINANTVNDGSAIDVGEISQPAWSSVHKNNYGTGKNIGINYLKQLANLIQDNDIIDSRTNFESGVSETQ